MKKIFVTVAILLSGAATLFLFGGIRCQKKCAINHDELVEFVSNELQYEIRYGNPNVDPDAYVDTVLKRTLQQRNK